jgi:hypothetical protein
MKKLSLLLTLSVILASSILFADDFKFYDRLKPKMQNSYNSLNNIKIIDFLNAEISNDEFIQLYDINTNERFMNDVLLKTEFEYDDYSIYDRRYLLVLDSLEFDSTSCMVYFDYETNTLYYYDYNNFRFLKQIKNPFIREVFLNDKYFTFFTDQYEFVTIDLKTTEIISRILPYAVITGDVIIMDDLLITTQHNGIAAYDIKSGEKEWINFETIVLPSRIKSYSDSSFYFIYEDKIEMVNSNNGETIESFDYDPYFYRVYLDYQNADLIMLGFEHLIFKNLFSDEEKRYDIAKIHEYDPFFYKNDYLYFLNKKAILRAKLEGDDKGFEIVKRFKNENMVSSTEEKENEIDKEPYINLEYLQKQLVYPENARLHSIEQKIVLYVECSRDGYPKRIVIESFETYAYLEEFFYQAATAVLKTRIDPILINGEQKSFTMFFPVRFRLR